MITNTDTRVNPITTIPSHGCSASLELSLLRPEDNDIVVMGEYRALGITAMN